jgi:hypothetical protein
VNRIKMTLPTRAVGCSHSREACEYEEPVRRDGGESGKDRLGKLEPQSERRWGKMMAAQMLAHCSVSMQWAVGEVVPEKGVLPASLIGRLVKPMVFRNEDPLRKNSPTAKSLIVADERNFGKERERLSGLIDKFAVGGAAGCTKNPHSFFGKMTPEERAILMYKHIDHHLRQFGV